MPSDGESFTRDILVATFSSYAVRSTSWNFSSVSLSIMGALTALCASVG